MMIESCVALMEVHIEELRQASYCPCWNDAAHNFDERRKFPKHDTPKRIRQWITKAQKGDEYSDMGADEVMLGFELGHSEAFLEACDTMLKTLRNGCFRADDQEKRTRLLSSLMALLLVVTSHA